MARQTQDSMLLVGVIAGGITLAAFLVLLVLFGFGFSPALFLSILVGLVAAIVLFRGFHDKVEPPAGVDTSAPVAAPAPAPAPEPTPEPAPAAAPEPAPAPAADPAPAAAAAAPAKLDAAREGGPDDLKKIKGVGPKLEALLHRMGFFHYDQVANWTDAEVAWVDENLEGFKGRVSRDGWVAQAKTLAAGGETEFSKKVDDGDVY